MPENEDDSERTLSAVLGSSSGAATSLPLARSVEHAVSVTLGSDTSPLPSVGLGAACHSWPLSAREVAALKSLGPAHLRLDLDLSSEGFRERFLAGTAEAAALETRLELALTVSDRASDELEALLPLLETARPRVSAWLVFHAGEKSTSARWVRIAREILRRYDPSAPVGGGTNAYFTELNRGRPELEAMDLVAYSMNPQVHAFDNASLVETLAAQGATVASARRFLGDLPLHVSPITLRPRFNPNATGPEPEPEPGTLPFSVDLRQKSLFGAGWTLGSLKYLAESGGAESLTYFETTGPRGVMASAEGMPAAFGAPPNAVYPLFHVLADVLDFTGGRVRRCRSERPLELEALALEEGSRRRILVASFSAQSLGVHLEGVTGEARVRTLSSELAFEAMAAPREFHSLAGERAASAAEGLQLTIPPLGYLRIDLLEPGR